MGFSGYWICLIWSLRFGILKQNRARFWNESMHRMWDAENNHQDYWIERKFGSRLPDWAEIWVKMTFRALRWRGVSTILHNIQGEASFRLTAFFRFTCVKGLLHNMQIQNSNHTVMKHIAHRSMSIKGFLYRLSDRSRIKTRQSWVRFVIHQSLATVVVLIVPFSGKSTLSPDEDLQYAVETSWSIPKWLSCFKR